MLNTLGKTTGVLFQNDTITVAHSFIIYYQLRLSHV